MVTLAAMAVRRDLGGVTSFVRALGLKSACYGCLLDFFHSPAVGVALVEIVVGLRGPGLDGVPGDRGERNVEVGLFAEAKLKNEKKIEKKLKRELEWLVEDGKRAKNHSQRR